MHPALFLDRDGVVNHEVGYLHLAADLHFTEGIFPLCRTAQSLGYRIVIVTNQSGIARGLYTEAAFDNLMDVIRDRFLSESVTLDAVYHCPYHPDATIEKYRREHPDRKPSPGMILRAAGDLSLDLERSILIGDRCSDLAAAHAAGLQQSFLLLGTEPNPCPEAACGPYLPIRHLNEAETWLRSHP